MEVSYNMVETMIENNKPFYIVECECLDYSNSWHEEYYTEESEAITAAEYLLNMKVNHRVFDYRYNVMKFTNSDDTLDSIAAFEPFKGRIY